MSFKRCEVWGRAAIAGDMLTVRSDEHPERKLLPMEVTADRPDKSMVVRDEHPSRKLLPMEVTADRPDKSMVVRDEHP